MYIDELMFPMSRFRGRVLSPSPLVTIKPLEPGKKQHVQRIELRPREHTEKRKIRTDSYIITGEFEMAQKSGLLVLFSTLVVLCMCVYPTAALPMQKRNANSRLQTFIDEFSDLSLSGPPDDKTDRAYFVCNLTALYKLSAETLVNNNTIYSSEKHFISTF